MSQEKIRAYWEKLLIHLDLSHHTSSYRLSRMNNSLCCWANKAVSSLSICFDRPSRWWGGGRLVYQCMVCLWSYSKLCCPFIKSILKAISKRDWHFFSKMEAGITFMICYAPPTAYPRCPLSHLSISDSWIVPCVCKWERHKQQVEKERLLERKIKGERHSFMYRALYTI